MDDREDRIRRRAHELWEQEGRPEGGKRISGLKPRGKSTSRAGNEAVGTGAPKTL